MKATLALNGLTLYLGFLWLCKISRYERVKFYNFDSYKSGELLYFPFLFFSCFLRSLDNGESLLSDSICDGSKGKDPNFLLHLSGNMQHFCFDSSPDRLLSKLSKVFLLNSSNSESIQELSISSSGLLMVGDKHDGFSNELK